MSRTLHPTLNSAFDIVRLTDMAIIRAWPGTTDSAVSVLCIGLVATDQSKAHVRLSAMYVPMGTNAGLKSIFRVQLGGRIATQFDCRYTCFCPLLIHQFEHFKFKREMMV